MKKIITLSICLFFGFISNAQTKIEALDALFESIDKTAPGVAVAVIDNGKTIYNKAFGMANLEYQVPLSTDAVFDIASLAKQFTGFAIAQLELEKKLSIDDPITKYFPTLTGLKENITIAHLLHHSSGLRDIGELFDVGHFGSELTAEKTLQIMARQSSLNFPPGSESDYSNTNYVLLAKIVEQVSEQPFSTWCNEHIFAPMQMSKSFANANPKVVIPNRAVAYYQNEKGFSFDQNNGMALIGSSAVFSSSSDMSRWARSLLTNKTYQNIFKKMQTKGKTNAGEVIDYAYGIAIQTYKGNQMIVHSGATPAGFRTAIALFPAKNKAVVLLSNLGNIDLANQFQHPIFDILFEKEEIAKEISKSIEQPRESVSLTEAQLDKFVGSFLFNEERTVHIRKGPNGLTVQPDGAPEMPLVPLSKNELHFEAFKSTLAFSNEIGSKFQKALILSPEGQRQGNLLKVDLISITDFNPEGYVGTYYAEELDLLWTITSNEKGLTIYDTKRGEIGLKPLTKTIVKGHEFKLKFDFNIKDKIVGFGLHRGNRLRDLKFKKVDLN